MMHPSLATIPTPPHLAPWVPAVRTRSVGVRFELGQIAPEPVPPPVYRDEPTIFFDPTAVVVSKPTPWRPRKKKVPKDCLDCSRGPGCGRPFLPRHPTAMRCPMCVHLRWHAKRRRAA